MTANDRRVDLKLGDFACSVQGFDDPVRPLRSVLRLVQRVVEETPELADTSLELKPQLLEDLLERLEKHTDIPMEELDVHPGLIVVHRGQVADEEAGDGAASGPKLSVVGASAAATGVSANTLETTAAGAAEGYGGYLSAFSEPQASPEDLIADVAVPDDVVAGEPAEVDLTDVSDLGDAPAAADDMASAEPDAGDAEAPAAEDGSTPPPFEPAAAEAEEPEELVLEASVPSDADEPIAADLAEAAETDPAEATGDAEDEPLADAAAAVEAPAETEVATSEGEAHAEAEQKAQPEAEAEVAATPDAPEILGAANPDAPGILGAANPDAPGILGGDNDGAIDREVVEDAALSPGGDLPVENALSDLHEGTSADAAADDTVAQDAIFQDVVAQDIIAQDTDAEHADRGHTGSDETGSGDTGSEDSGVEETHLEDMGADDPDVDPWSASTAAMDEELQPEAEIAPETAPGIAATPEPSPAASVDAGTDAMPPSNTQEDDGLAAGVEEATDDVAAFAEDSALPTSEDFSGLAAVSGEPDEDDRSDAEALGDLDNLDAEVLLSDALTALGAAEDGNAPGHAAHHRGLVEPQGGGVKAASDLVSEDIDGTEEDLFADGSVIDEGSFEAGDDDPAAPQRPRDVAAKEAASSDPTQETAPTAADTSTSEVEDRRVISFPHMLGTAALPPELGGVHDPASFAESSEIETPRPAPQGLGARTDGEDDGPEEDAPAAPLNIFDTPDEETWEPSVASREDLAETDLAETGESAGEGDALDPGAAEAEAEPVKEAALDTEEMAQTAAALADADASRPDALRETARSETEEFVQDLTAASAAMAGGISGGVAGGQAMVNIFADPSEAIDRDDPDIGSPAPTNAKGASDTDDAAGGSRSRGKLFRVVRSALDDAGAGPDPVPTDLDERGDDGPTVNLFADPEDVAPEPVPAAESAAEPATVSRFENLFHRYGGTEDESQAEPGPATDSETGDDGGAADEDGFTARDLATAAGAQSVPDLLASAAAWLTLVREQSRFTRQDVMAVFEGMPGPHQKTLEARIKGYGKLVRSGQLVLVDDGLFALSMDERDKFQSFVP